MDYVDDIADKDFTAQVKKAQKETQKATCINKYESRVRSIGKKKSEIMELNQQVREMTDELKQDIFTSGDFHYLSINWTALNKDTYRR